MQLRRSFALTTAAVALATAGLSSCGFDYATDREYTPGVGTNDRDGTVDVLSAVVVSTEPGSGTFIASLSNGDQETDVALTELALTDGTPVELEPVVVGKGALVNLAEPAAEIKVTGEFAAGDFVELSLAFDNGERVVMDVPVVENEGYYADLDGPAPAEEPTEDAEHSTESEH
ncbi:MULTISPECIES: hypothetical protein [Nocardioides]|uniref:hypothetical protein n=1 Tax=Nocardioides TaxID=1839 RepID=UPI000330A29B|nr:MULTISPECIES: hypothetical protein [Nocardioides]EON22701.1 hypothetical protein CF8_3291 [Nocardioides sp. CF8]